MAITKKPTKPTPADTFISGAPDSTASTADAPRRVRKGRKVQITLTITESMLARVDELAAQLGQSRAAVINLAIFQTLETGVRIDGGD
ncbi:ribbon-helix-helix domain-containing protein [Plasticicumulans acidivorans]|uniref:Ribbon-helix-helix CopG family protein n=1 Tax=Plasticicumulans acidivorans TaxID=886464 RepID=A0A317MMY0_9GAMM|nr:ribbon-helix-helix domain-containing protein [Plasticicumulans acidivorans]PWV57742.1 ribbon-helix-helix CopG family protein [Plasticicumulans acidivorans]